MYESCDMMDKEGRFLGFKQSDHVSIRSPDEMAEVMRGSKTEEVKRLDISIDVPVVKMS